MTFLGQLAKYALKSYVKDTVQRSQEAAGRAILYCRATQKPLLHVGRGILARNRVRDALIGSQAFGDVNLDLCQRGSHALAYRLPYDDGYFGAVLATHVLEYLERPWDGLEEWHRVADRVMVTVADWTSPHAWIDPDRRWLITPDLNRAIPLWCRENRVWLMRPEPCYAQSRELQPTAHARRGRPGRPDGQRARRAPVRAVPGPSGRAQSRSALPARPKDRNG